MLKLTETNATLTVMLTLTVVTATLSFNVLPLTLATAMLKGNTLTLSIAVASVSGNTLKLSVAVKTVNECLRVVINGFNCNA